MIQREQIDALAARAAREEQAKLVLLYNGYTAAAKAYRDQQGDQALRAWQRAEAAVDGYAAELADKYGVALAGVESGEFRTQQEVLGYLQGKGYKIGKSALSNHVRAGRLRKKNGVFPRAAVDRYAGLALVDASSGQGETAERIDKLQERKLRAEIQKLEEQAIRARIEREAAEGRYMERIDHELHMAMAAGVLEAGLKYFYKLKAAAMVELVHGDPQRAADLAVYLREGLDRQLAGFARAREYEVEIEGEDDGGTA